MNAKQEESLLQKFVTRFIFVMMGVIFMYSSLSIRSIYAIFLLILGIALSAYGLGSLLSTIGAMDKLRKKSIHENKSGVIWVWIVCFFTMILYAIAWFALGWAFNIFYDAITSLYTFPPPLNFAVTFMMTVIAWHPILMFFGLLLWAYVNSQRREDVTYPTY
jgi:uncharacterized membrane protein YidH (DUF202 family)